MFYSRYILEYWDKISTHIFRNLFLPVLYITLSGALTYMTTKSKILLKEVPKTRNLVPDPCLDVLLCVQYLPWEMDTFLGVLTFAVLFVFTWLVLDHFHAFSRLTLLVTVSCYHKQLAYTILKTKTISLRSTLFSKRSLNCFFLKQTSDIHRKIWSISLHL